MIAPNTRRNQNRPALPSLFNILIKLLDHEIIGDLYVFPLMSLKLDQLIDEVRIFSYHYKKKYHNLFLHAI